MKKSLLSLALVAFVGIASAQTQQGGWVVGASSQLGFSSNSQDGVADNESVINLGTRTGYFVIENLSIGVLLNYTNSSQGDFKSTDTAIGPWARYYVGGQFFLGAAYGAVSGKTGSGGSEFKTSGGVLIFEGGYPIFMGDNVAIEPALNYSSGSGDFEGDSSFGLGLSFMLYF
jgi:hypothetical protein